MKIRAEPRLLSRFKYPTAFTTARTKSSIVTYERLVVLAAVEDATSSAPVFLEACLKA